MSVGEISSLLLCGQSRAGVYVYNEVSKTAEIANANELEWSLEFLLKAFNKKHIWEPARAPAIGTVVESLFDWRQKLRWAHHFEGSHNNHGHLVSRQGKVAVCPHGLPQRAERFVDFITDGILERCYSALGSFRHRHVPVPPLVQFALRRLPSSRYVPMLTDKDGGFALVRRGAVRSSIGTSHIRR